MQQNSKVANNTKLGGCWLSPRLRDAAEILINGSAGQSPTTRGLISAGFCTKCRANTRLPKSDFLYVALCNKEHWTSCFKTECWTNTCKVTVRFYLSNPCPPWQALQQCRQHCSQMWRYKGAGLFGNWCHGSCSLSFHFPGLGLQCLLCNGYQLLHIQPDATLSTCITK